MIFGYTLWFAKHFSDGQAPFLGRDSSPDCADCLKAPFVLREAWRLKALIFYACALAAERLRKIEVMPNPDKKEGRFILILRLLKILRMIFCRACY